MNELDQVMDYVRNLNTRLTALEKSCCNASHAPSSKESAPASPDASAPSRSDSPSSSPSCGEPSTDSARRALADEANWPKWLTREAASTLPEGVERVWGRRGDQLWCYPGMHYWGATTGWDICSWSESHMGDGMFKNQQVYHLPPAAKGEGDAWSRWGAAHHPDMWTRERFNAFVAGESQAKYQQGFKDGEAVAEHKHRELENAVNYLASLPKPDAGRAEGVKPKPSPGEVAEDDLIEGAWSLLANVGSLGGGWASQGSVWQMAAQSWRDKYTKRAAIVRERSAP